MPAAPLLRSRHAGQVSDEGVEVLVGRLTGLRNLDLSDCRLVTDRAVHAIAAQLAHLTQLELSHCWCVRSDIILTGGAALKSSSSQHATEPIWTFC